MLLNFFFSFILKLRSNKLECWSQVGFTGKSNIIDRKFGYSSLELSDPMVQKRGRVGTFGVSAPDWLQGCQMSKYPWPLALPTNLRIDWKDLPITNALAYLAHLRVIKRKKVLKYRHQECPCSFWSSWSPGFPSESSSPCFPVSPGAWHWRPDPGAWSWALTLGPDPVAWPWRPRPIYSLNTS